MNVLHVLGKSTFGGTEQHVLRLTRDLSTRGCDVAIACPRGAAQLRAEADRLGIPVVGLRPSITTIEPAVVHAHDGFSALIGSILATIRNAAFVRTQHFVRPASDERTGLMRSASLALHRTINRRLDGYIAVSQAAADAAIERRDAQHARLAVIGSGAMLADAGQVENAQLRRATADEPVIVSAGRLRPERRFEVLIEALPAILDRHPRCRVVIAGAGPEEPALRAQASQLGVRTAIDWTGWLPDIAPALARGHVYVNTCPYEGFGMATAEAMGYALPVVVTDSGSAPELVNDGVTGRIVQREDPAALASVMVELLGDRVRASAMGAAGRQRAIETYSTSATADATLGFYQQILDMRRGGRRRCVS